MRKFRVLLVLALGVTMALSLAGLASANGGPHGGYAANTDACAGCHRTHTALGPNLLLFNSTYLLCMSCHGNSGSGADSNVIDGRWIEGRNAADTTGDANTTDGAALLGGGFTNYQSRTVSSRHVSSGTVGGIWGAAITRGLQSTPTAFLLDCADCHDPHGSTNYRIIKTTVSGTAVAVTQVDEGAGKDYDTEQWSGTGMNSFCGACHTTYLVTSVDSGISLTASTVGGFGGSYAHQVGQAYNAGSNAGAQNPDTLGYGSPVSYYLPLADNSNVVCTTCHLPHGTSMTMTGYALGTYDPAGAAPPIPSQSSALLRLENRGVCEVCHQK